MHVGKALAIQSLGDEADGEVLAHELALAERAELQGFQSLFLPEHHFSDYHLAPNVMQLLTYLAARTTHIRLGSAVIVLPWHEPLRVAEELSVLDHLSKGRLIVGLGRGLGRVEFEGFRLDMGESRGRFVEYAEALMSAFDTGVMTYDGEFYRQPPVSLRPTPLAPLRGRVYASAVSPESIELMARLGFGVMVIAQKPWATTEAEVRDYKDRFVTLNGSEPPMPLLVAQVAVHESASAAEEMFEEWIVGYAQSALDHYEFDNEALARVPGYEYYGKLAENIKAKGADAFVRFLAGLQIWGTPDQVVEQLVTNARRLDAAGVLPMTSYGGMPPQVSTQNQDLFARTVLPRLHAIDGHRQIPDVARVPAAR